MLQLISYVMLAQSCEFGLSKSCIRAYAVFWPFIVIF